MIRRNPKSRRPRGLSAVEAAAVYPIASMLLMGTVLVSLGVFRYHQVQSLAREGARYASVNGPAYAAATGNAEASTTSVLSHINTMAVGLSGLSCSSVSYSATSLPCTVSVTLSYTWKPGGFFSSMTWTPTSTMPVTY